MEVPATVWIGCAIITIIITYLSIWVVNKGYSRRWEDDEK